MGRVKLQIKKIENTTNRQVTFSKRRNGLIKKAYELSVLCDVDVALIMFSPSGRVSSFSGNNRSVEEILDRYVNLPEHERGRLQNQEYLQRALGKLRAEAGQIHEVPRFRFLLFNAIISDRSQSGRDRSHSRPTSSDSQLEEIQNELAKCKSQLEDLEQKLRIFEGELSGIATLDEAEYRENILEETLGHLRIHKQSLMEKYKPFSTPPTSQVHIPSETLNTNGFVDGISSKMIMDWIPQRDPQAQILNFLDSNGLLPSRNSSPRVSEMLQLSSSSLVLGQSAMNIENHMSPGSGIDDNCNVHHRSEFGHVVDVNLSQWPEFYSTGNDAYPESQPRGRESAELFSSPFT